MALVPDFLPQPHPSPVHSPIIGSAARIPPAAFVTVELPAPSTGPAVHIREHISMYLLSTEDPPYQISYAGDLTLNRLLEYAASRNGSDLFLKAGSPPKVKVNGTIEPTTFPSLSESDVVRLAFERMDDGQKTRFERDRELNLAFTVEGVTRIRQNVYWQRDTVATACRLIPLRAKSLADLNIDSKAISALTESHNGLVLVTGPTGSGKSTTLAAIIDHINSTRHANIITIEDPIE